jgi:tyrosine-protein phosphatase YwqE
MPGRWKFFFKSRQQTVWPDYSQVGADMHSHLIPGIDDGAQSTEQSLQLLMAMQDLGFRKIITTPHIMSDHYRNNPAIIHSGLQTVKAAMAGENISLEIEAAAEYYLDDIFLKKLNQEELLTFGNGYLLMEVSFINPPENIRDIIFQIQLKGYKPVLAHPERYPFWAFRFSEYEYFKDSGVLLQINAGSIAGFYGPEAKRTSERLIDAKMVDFIGTDLHKAEQLEGLRLVCREKYFRKLLALDLLNRHL